MKPFFRLVVLTSFFSSGFVSAVAAAQQTEDTGAVPASLPELPGIAVPWPDLDAFAPAEGERPRRRAAFRDNLRYSVEIQGLKEVGLEASFRDLSTLLADRDSPASGAQINRRSEADVKAITQLLSSYGYYAPSVDVTVQPVQNETGRVEVTLTVTPGPRYTFSDIRLLLPDDTSDATRDLVERWFPLLPGDAIVASKVESAEAELMLKLPQRGYPFAELGTRQVLLDDLEQTGIYTLPVQPGPVGVFGDIRLTGDRLFSERHTQVLARFRPGDPYDNRDVEDLRQALVETGLFSRVALRPVLSGEELPDGRSVVDMEIETEKGPQRRLAARGGYATGDGFRVEGEWTHRNLLPPEGAVTFRAVAGTKEQRLGAELRRSNAGRRGRTLLATVEASNENRDAYDAQALTLSAGFVRLPDITLERRWGYALGGELLITNQRDRSLFVEDGDDSKRRRTFIIGALPAVLQYDGSNDVLDPTRGFRVAGRATPEAAFQDSIFGYTRFRVDASGYLPLKDDDVVLAGRVALGAIAGAGLDRIAPSRRFYAGGGGSVRGFGYQELGPKDSEGDPVGGRSLTEVSAELRYRFGDYGLVAFVDGGQVYTEKLPQFSGLRFGAGIGARYYTPFGPLRFDVATPISRRSGDPKFAVYISIGQAF